LTPTFGLVLYSLAPEYLYFEIAAAIALTIFLELAYRKALKNYVIIENFVLDDKQKINYLPEDTPTAKLIILAVLYIAMAVLLVFYISSYDKEKLLEIGIIALVIIFSIYQSVFYLIATMKALEK